MDDISSYSLVNSCKCTGLSFQANRKVKLKSFQGKRELAQMKKTAWGKWPLAEPEGALSYMLWEFSMGLVVNIRGLGEVLANYLSAKTSRQWERQSLVGPWEEVR